MEEVVWAQSQEEAFAHISTAKLHCICILNTYKEIQRINKKSHCMLSLLNRVIVAKQFKVKLKKKKNELPSQNYIIYGPRSYFLTSLLDKYFSLLLQKWLLL